MVWAEYALMLACSGLAIAGMRASNPVQLAVIAAVVALYAGVAILLEKYLYTNAEV
jgi:hypothetical protein